MLRLAALLLTLLAGSPHTQSDRQTIRFDLGEVAPPEGAGWNALLEPGRTGRLLIEARDSAERRTGVRWHQVDPWSDAEDEAALTSVGWPRFAIRDCFIARQPTRFRLEGLEPRADYDLSFLGPRRPSLEPIASGRFRSGDRRAVLTAAGPVLCEWRLEDVSADANGQLTLTVHGSPTEPVEVMLIELRGPFSAPQPARAPAEDLGAPPVVSAAAWAIADGTTGEILWSHRADTVRHMASTTKIMTAWIALEMAADRPELLERRIRISETADRTGGSTAGLRTGEELTVSDLMHALLLPSGNDAAIAVAEVFGCELGAPTPDEAVERFVAEMNRRATRLGMTRTRYDDPHGNSANASCAGDLVRLAIAARRNEAFRRIVATRQHVCRLRTPAGTFREVTWRNTNRLLDIEGYDGIKTGTTTGAGACLVSTGELDGQRLIVVVLGSTSREGRYVDSRNLYRHAWRQLEAAGGR